MAQNYTGPLERVDATRWRIPRSYKKAMNVDGLHILVLGAGRSGEAAAQALLNMHKAGLAQPPPVVEMPDPADIPPPVTIDVPEL